MADPTTLGGVGMAAVATFPVGGTVDQITPQQETTTVFRLNDVDLLLANQLRAQSVEINENIGGIKHLEFIHQSLRPEHYTGGVVGFGDGGYGAGGYGGGNLPPHVAVGQRILYRVGSINYFLGTVERIEEELVRDVAMLITRIEAVDHNSILDRRVATSAESYAAKTVGFIVNDLFIKYLTTEPLTMNSVQIGPTIATFSIKIFTSISQALRDLSDRTGYIFFVDATGDLHFEPQTAQISPFDVGSVSPDEIPLYTPIVRKIREQYRNRQTVRYGSGTSLSVTVNNTSEQKNRAEIEGGSGIHHNIVDASEITTSAEASSLANALLRRYAVIPKIVEFSTNRSGLRVGQKLELNLPEHDAVGTYLIDNVRISDEGVSRLRWDIVALSGEHLEDPIAFWRKLKGG